jgi:hypothetical protein
MDVTIRPATGDDLGALRRLLAELHADDQPIADPAGTWRRARAAGCYKVQLLSRMDRAAAHALYEASGLRPVAAGYRVCL